MASCPECKNRCIDFKSEVEEEKLLVEESAKRKRRDIFRHVGLFLISLPFLYEVITWSESTLRSDLTFLLFMAGALGIGPLRDIDWQYKIGSVIVVLWLLFFFLWVPLVSTPLKYFLIVIPAIPLFLLVEKATELFSRIYR